MKKNRWKKALALVIATGVLFSNIGMVVAQAVTIPDTVRIGLSSKYKNVNSIALNNQELLLGVWQNGNFYEETSFSENMGFVVSTTGQSYSRLRDTFSGYKDAYDMVRSYQNNGKEAVVAMEGKGLFAVYFYGNSIGEGNAVTSGQTMELKSGVKTLIVIGTGIAPCFGTKDQDGLMKLSKSYHGYLEIGRYNSGALTAVNLVSMDDYLCGVIPMEMPASYEMEALKAQAVAARSYAMTQMGVHKSDGYELCDTVHCQVYGGVTGENSRTNQAVMDTKGTVATYNGSVINAVFFASSGGYTENSENVWSANLPYLRAVDDSKEIGTDIWKREITLTQLVSLLSAKGENIGVAKDLLITKTATGGRVQELQIVGTSGVKTLTGESIRTYFSSVGGSFPSKCFTINGNTTGVINTGNTEQNTDITRNEKSIVSAVFQNGVVVMGCGLDGKTIPVEGLLVSGNNTQDSVTRSAANAVFVIEGKGNGHGVGMSQKGAQGLAKAGQDYESILKHYYTGIQLER